MSVKAYELVQIIQRFSSPSGEKNVKIECVECSGKYVFIGTSDGHVVKYIVHETTAKSNIGSPFTYQREGQRYFDAKKPVRSIRAASALEKLLVLFDTTLHVLNMNDLEPIGSRLKSVQTFCVNENPKCSDPFLFQICVAPVSKGQVCIYNVTPDDKINLSNTYTLQEPIKCLSADCGIICAALQDKYIILDCDHGQVQDLFPFDKDAFTPYLCKVAKEEFLLSGPDGLGIFVCAAGTSNRPPLQWSYPLTSLTFHHPYILGVSHEIIMVHSIVDQQQKQAIPFLGGQLIGNYDGHIYVCSQTSLNALVPVPWEKQVEALLVDEHVEEALSLLEKVGNSGHLVGQIDPVKKRFKQQAAFIYFSRSELEIALDLFLDAEVDERELISIFPRLMPSATTFLRTVPPLHNIADVNQLFHGNEQRILEAKQFLLHFLQMAHDSRKSSYTVEIDTALLKLYAELGQNKDLESLLESASFSGDVQSCLAWLKDRGLHHARALLLLQKGNRSEALSLWCQMISGELFDSNFKGISFFADVLKAIGDAEVLWQYADLVLDNNEVDGVELFIQNQTAGTPTPTMELDPHTVADYLQRYPKALILYLEYLINEKGIEEEKFHTQLAVQYIDIIAKQKTQDTGSEVDLNENIQRLRRFLEKSNQYRSKFLLSKVRDLGLYQEVAILYGKVGT
ncbi:Transforming growth factor-beta receptor-associated protein 1 [Frankliniella fusca]|uniref:Transforming growth factor-beta receptor-associated protein 1 n=1 Tax=Frankliniella fusca TaxID=407009 RepID=A0AAE1HQ61_9NEOP|nr:Transforming growth factor-beta receptor-associated protein 1 [Frankliniella fusca]